MEDNKINNNNNNNFEYTIVLDASYNGPENSQEAIKDTPAPAEKDPEKEKAAEKAREAAVRKAEMDHLYLEYEEMCMKDPTVLDEDDIYPHSYYWRLGDRYDPEKIAVIEEAMKLGVRLEKTEAYEKYVEDIKRRRFTPVSWD